MLGQLPSCWTLPMRPKGSCLLGVLPALVMLLWGRVPCLPAHLCLQLLSPRTCTCLTRSCRPALPPQCLAHCSTPPWPACPRKGGHFQVLGSHQAWGHAYGSLGQWPGNPWQSSMPQVSWPGDDVPVGPAYNPELLPRVRCLCWGAQDPSGEAEGAPKSSCTDHHHH